MPTPSTFLTAADALDAAAAEAARLLAPPGTLLTPEVLDGGLLTEKAAQAIAACADRLATVAGALSDAARECRRRAVVCELYRARVTAWERADAAYAQALREWHASDTARRAVPSSPDPGPLPTSPGARPAEPYAWVG